MRADELVFSLPRWRVTRWLAEPGDDVPAAIRTALIGELYGCWSVFAGGAINSIVVAAALAIRNPTPPFLICLVLDVVVCVARLSVMLLSYRAARRGRPTPTDIHLLLAVAWSVSVGLSVSVSLVAGDWIAACVSCLSAAGMVGGICFRNYGAPRLVGTMILCSMGPVLPGVALSGEPLMTVIYVQTPLYFMAITAAAFRLNRMLIAVLRSKADSEDRARLDALTGLSNRAGLVHALETRARSAAPELDRFALLYLDLDHFKPVNDTFGHAAGDELLRIVAGKLCELLPQDAVIVRIGGDEFVLLADGRMPDDALALGERIIGTITAPITLKNGISVGIGVSVGIALHPDHGTTAEALLSAADAALYEAKSSGKSCCRLASMEANLAALRRLTDDGTGAPLGAVA